MHCFLVEIASEPKDNMIEEREEIKTLISDILNENYDITKGETLRNLLDEEMKTRFTSEETRRYYLSVDSMWRSDRPHMKSFFVGIQMKNRRPLHLFAQYRQLTSLKEIAAWSVARRLKKSINFSLNLETLQKEGHIPKPLTSEVRNFFPTKSDENKNEIEVPTTPTSSICLTTSDFKDLRGARARGL